MNSIKFIKDKDQIGATFATGYRKNEVEVITCQHTGQEVLFADGLCLHGDSLKEDAKQVKRYRAFKF